MKAFTIDNGNGIRAEINEMPSGNYSVTYTCPERDRPRRVVYINLAEAALAAAENVITLCEIAS